ncbi:cytochrome bc1 complex cytochrome b subunit [Geodermatophilus maliterrae]|uniref:Cytochrome bc1 complex cytochrome b subunit n=1 Tax=Geodermatophilus maliterrae TaxID=3162531 RepID=A0ABV3X9Y5_9ACTN
MARRVAAPGTGEADAEIDDRSVASNWLRRTLNKVYPDHWSFLLGEIVVYSFIVLLLSGIYLTFFFDASMREVTYEGSYAPLRGVEVSAAYDSALQLSFDVRGGLFVRQVHHWAALLFIAAIVLHLLRVFFTGAFRRPRETNWIIGVGLLVLALLDGVTGYTVLDDLLSGSSLRIISAIILSIPLIGTWANFALFGGEFAGELVIGRLYVLHVLLIPGILLALIAVHLLIRIKQEHTQFPGSGRTEHNVVGTRLFPTHAGKATGLCFVVSAVCAALGGLVQINPVWLWGPYDPAHVSAATQPDWYTVFLEGANRLFPAWDIDLPGGYTIPAMFWPTVVLPGVLFTLLALYPVIERRLTGDTASHHLLQRPRDVPVRTSLGMVAIAFYVVLVLAGAGDVIADEFDISLNAMIWIGRIGCIVLPPIAYVTTYRICLGLQQHDREVLEHGIGTGVIRRRPDGALIELHQPLGPVDVHGHGVLQYGGAPVPKKTNHVGAARRAIRGFFAPIETAARVELEQHAERRGPAEAHAVGGREPTTCGRPSEGGRPSDGGRPQEPRD